MRVFTSADCTESSPRSETVAATPAHAVKIRKGYRHRQSVAGDCLTQAFEVRHPFSEQAHLLALGVDALAQVLALPAQLVALDARLVTKAPKRRADRNQDREGRRR